MAQHISCQPMTPQQRADYAKATRVLAAKETDPRKRDVLQWIASNYERAPE
jgi:hypothetical protein